MNKYHLHNKKQLEKHGKNELFLLIPESMFDYYEEHRILKHLGFCLVSEKLKTSTGDRK